MKKTNVNNNKLRRDHGKIAQKLLSLTKDSITIGDDNNWVAISNKLSTSYALIQNNSSNINVNYLELFDNNIMLWSNENLVLNEKKWKKLSNMPIMEYDLIENYEKLNYDSRVRISVESDILNVSNVQGDAFNIPKLENNESSPWSNHVGNIDPNVIIYVVEIGGTIAGSLTTVIYDKVVHLWSMSVGKSFQRQGIATSLLNYSLKTSFDKGAKMGYLCSTEEGIPLYKKFGWTEIDSLVTYVNY